MATIEKAQTGQQQTQESSENRAGVDPKNETARSGEFGDATANLGTCGLSSVPGGKSSDSPAGDPGATEGWSQQIKEGASGFVNRAQDLASEVSQKAQDIAGDLAQRAQDITSQATDSLGTTIRRYPIQALLVGFGLGCLVGLMLPSRR